MWKNHIFEFELFSDDLQKFVDSMTPAQRKATRTIAFDIRADDSSGLRYRKAATPLEPEGLLAWRQPMRDSYLALTKLQRVELFVDVWPGTGATTPLSFPLYFHTTSAVPPNPYLRVGKFHIIGE
jgi:hypothetical protein